MKLPKSISKAVAKEKEQPLQVKTFVFSFEDLENCDADDTVNAFCAIHNTVGIVLDRHKSKMIYRIIYRKE